ncbi:MAG: bifunctional phosphopantothenoylcysteine decarboxylase/phosphopantothenate--cysteine ligase CoaBC [Euryarchaeota archaeon]|nr:bifunctional phosphopantothenoylcysteine decarboxylase/phosphopantothenate--cysteine ligase CoaBC [Euryarchaeota archaeon]
MHPSSELRGTKSKRLEGKRIVLGVTGSIAAVECVRLVRELIRHGAEVFPVMSPAAGRIVHPDALWFASGNRPVTGLTGNVEHVSLCGKGPDRSDLLLVAPATSNTISKMACGIDDTPVTTFAVTAIGAGVPVMVVPAMHESMYAHPVVKENLRKLESLGVGLISPRLSENKAKMASVEDVVLAVLRRLGRGDLKGKRVLVIAGSTRERIDDVRCVTNFSTGRTGIEIAIAAWTRGADVELWYGSSPEQPPGLFPSKRFDSLDSLNALVTEATLVFDTIIVPAAISDYTVSKAPGKLGSERPVTVELHPAPKVLRSLRRRFKGVLVGFKAETGTAPDELEKRAREMMDSSDADMAVANDLADVSDDATRILIIPRKGGVRTFSGGKTEAADAVLDEVVKAL